jgi:hypothetical protein
MPSKRPRAAKGSLSTEGATALDLHVIGENHRVTYGGVTLVNAVSLESTLFIFEAFSSFYCSEILFHCRSTFFKAFCFFGRQKTTTLARTQDIRVCRLYVNKQLGGGTQVSMLLTCVTLS